MGYHLRNGQGHLSEGVWKNREQRKSILKYCPDLGIILQMKLERERCEGDNGEGEIIKVEGLGDEKKEGEEKKVAKTAAPKNTAAKASAAKGAKRTNVGKKM